ncbi:hypothetical protein DL96DRAFT_1703567 [Flagelloscypha sp. PMI_526]|nr:hypothetical protein DL96DRAFT_1703567 [Flagelloscypha sp. PMI_526]
MGWLSSLFSAPARGSPRTLDTSEAFSLPMGSPTLSPQPDGGSFTYPPTYASLDASKSVLPMHHDARHSTTNSGGNYTPLAKTWHRLRTWLAREYPELGDTLNYGILPEELANLEMQFGFPLPGPVRDSYLCCDGQEPESAASSADGLFFGLSLLPLEDVLEEWRFWRIVDDDPTTGANAKLRDVMQSIPPGWVRREYSQRGWIPLVADKTGNYIGVDMAPDEQGQSGQVIVFGRDFDSKIVLWRGEGTDGWSNWLASFVEELELGETFEIGASVEPGSGSEDDVGYESYFYDGMGKEGGEAGSGGGLRLTGEYRGWNVLEALADRSVRKWYEAGVIAEGTLPVEEDAKGQVNDLAVQLGSGAEVAIPVVNDQDDPAEGSSSQLAPTLNEIPPSPTSTTALTQSVSQPATPLPQQVLKTRVPTIAVTKPPAPMPVELPTAGDIVALPSPPDSRSNSFDEDLESGMREAKMSNGLVSRPPNNKRHPLEPEGDDERDLPGPPPPAKKEETVDLLTGDQPLVDTTEEAPLEGTSSTSKSVDKTDEEEEEEMPESTVRLVKTGQQKTPEPATS